jgi:hypothetical protein
MASKHTEERISDLEKLYKKLEEGPQDRKLNLATYMMMLAYHLDLLTEIKNLAEAMENGDEEFVKAWMDYRINNVIKKEENIYNDNENLHAAKYQESQQPINGPTQDEEDSGAA